MKKFPVHIIHKHAYPPLLTHISDPPKALYVRGEIPSNPDTKYLCVVGSRNHTPYGKDVCKMLISGLHGYNICIISGLALGMDTCAHKTALETDLCTIAIPGSGLDETVLYPRTNTQLATRILEAGGALISEEEPTYKATPYSFPKRNRIMAGMCHATLVIEAELKSGTLITSKYATDYNRDVCAVPGSIFSRKSDGPHMLIRLGATPIRTSEDILDVLNIKNKHSQQYARSQIKQCSDEERAVLHILSTPMSRNELIRILVSTLNKQVSEINTILMMMEIKQLIVERMEEIHIL